MDSRRRQLGSSDDPTERGVAGSLSLRPQFASTVSSVLMHSIRECIRVRPWRDVVTGWNQLALGWESLGGMRFSGIPSFVLVGSVSPCFLAVLTRGPSPRRRVAVTSVASPAFCSLCCLGSPRLHRNSGQRGQFKVLLSLHFRMHQVTRSQKITGRLAQKGSFQYAEWTSSSSCRCGSSSERLRRGH